MLVSTEAASTFSMTLVSTSRWASVVFLWSPTSMRGVQPAMSWRARAPAVTTNSNELLSLLLSIIIYSVVGPHPHHLCLAPSRSLGVSPNEYPSLPNYQITKLPNYPLPLSERGADLV